MTTSSLKCLKMLPHFAFLSLNIKSKGLCKIALLLLLKLFMSFKSDVQRNKNANIHGRLQTTYKVLTEAYHPFWFILAGLTICIYGRGGLIRC